MKRKLIVCGALWLGMFVQVNAAVVEDKNGLEIDGYDIDVLLEKGTSAAQRQLIENENKFKNKISEIYLTKAVAANAKKEGLADSPEEQARLQALIDRFYFRLKLKSLKTENLPDFEPLAKLRYNANPHYYFYPEQVDVSHILIELKRRDKDQALQMAKDLRDRLQKGEDFSNLAFKFSEDTTAKLNKGELGLYPRGVMPKQFDQVAFVMKEGEISEPVLTEYGYHIIKLNRHEAKRDKTFEEAKEEIIQEIRKDYIQNRVDGYYEQIKAENNMQFNEEELKRYRDKKLQEIAGEESSKEKESQNSSQEN